MKKFLLVPFAVLGLSGCASQLVVREVPNEGRVQSGSQIVEIYNAFLGRHYGKAVADNTSSCRVRATITGLGFSTEVRTLEPGVRWEKPIPLSPTSYVSRVGSIKMVSVDPTCDGGYEAVTSFSFNDVVGWNNYAELSAVSYFRKKQ